MFLEKAISELHFRQKDRRGLKPDLSDDNRGVRFGTEQGGAVYAGEIFLGNRAPAAAGGLRGPGHGPRLPGQRASAAGDEPRPRDDGWAHSAVVRRAVYGAGAAPVGADRAGLSRQFAAPGDDAGGGAGAGNCGPGGVRPGRRPIGAGASAAGCRPTARERRGAAAAAVRRLPGRYFYRHCCKPAATGIGHGKEGDSYESIRINLA